MYSEQLEKLIELALADGELTEKEKQILFKRAEAEGIDLDEFEMVLEAKLFEKTKNKTSEPIAAPQSNKFGDIKKCPSCGAIVESFSTKCTDCGFNFTNVESIASIRTFFNDYQLIESKVQYRESTGFLNKFIDDNDHKIAEWKKAVFIKKKEFIMHFPIANSKEDILEFLTLAIPLANPAKKGVLTTFKKLGSFMSNDNDKNYDFLIAQVWHQKCEQIIMKARFSMKEDTKTLNNIEEYASELGNKIPRGKPTRYC